MGKDFPGFKHPPHYFSKYLDGFWEQKRSSIKALKVKDLSNSIETLSEKTDGLIKAYRSVKDKTDSLSAENAKLKSKIGGLSDDIIRLKEENKVLRMAAAFKGDGEAVTETKRRISQMVREIDRCIAQLND